MSLPIDFNSSYNNTLSAPLSYNFGPNKGIGKYSYPIGNVAGNSRPLCNKDYTNNTVYRQGSARPLKWQFRRQSNQKKIIIVDPNNPNNYIETYNINNRVSKSQSTSSLISNLIDKPGGYSVKLNTQDEINNVIKMTKECSNCDGINVIVDFKKPTDLTNNPEPVSTCKTFCCNNEAKAKKMVIYASTNLKNNYFNRCLTYEQRAFNFQSGINMEYAAKILANNPNITPADILAAKPGSPLDASLYIANCYPNAGEPSQYDLVSQLFQLINGEKMMTQEEINIYYSSNIQLLWKMNVFLGTIGNSVVAQQMFQNFINNPIIISQLSNNNKNCKLVVYKPSNYTFACEGGVDASLRTLQLTVNTISQNLASINSLRGAGSKADVGPNPYIYKNKVEKCQKSLPIFMRNVGVNNPKTCFKSGDDVMYKALSKMGNIGGIFGTEISMDGQP
jgi:hypothetical protein